MIAQSNAAVAALNQEPLLSRSVKDALALQQALITALVQAAHIDTAVFDSVTGQLVPK